MVHSSSSTAIQLSLSTTYYLRKLLHQNLHNLKSIVVAGVAIEVHEFCDINAVLESLYLEPEELASVVSQLDRAVATHEAMAAQPGQFHQERVALEEKIFWLLGYKFRSLSRAGVVYKGSVLLVESDPNAVTPLVEALREQNYEVTIASSGQQALAQLSLNLPDTVVAAVQLPDMTGDKLCQRLKDSAHCSAIPVILLGTVDNLQEEEKAFEAGAIDYLVKPFQVQDLTLRLQARRQLQDFQERLTENNKQLQLEVQKTRRLEERARSVFEDSVVGMFQSTVDGRYLKVNRALATLYGYGSPQDLLNQVSHIDQQVYVDSQRRQEFIAYMQKYHAVISFESQVYRQSGSPIWISESVRSVYGESGEFLFYEGTVLDITAQKRLEQQFQTQYRVTDQLARVSALLQGSQILLREVGTLLGWHRGEVWLLRSPMDVLQNVDRWHYTGATAVSDPPMLHQNEGLPGFIWSHEKPIWIADLQQLPYLTVEERVRYAGVKSVIGFPCYQGDRFLGVVLWLSKEMVELEDGILAAVEVMVQQFGQFVVRRYTENNRRQTEMHLRAQADDLIAVVAEMKAMQQGLVEAEKQAIMGKWVQEFVQDLMVPMDEVYHDLTHASDYVQDLMAAMKAYREKVPESLQGQDGVKLDALMQDFPQLVNSIHEGVQKIHHSVESMMQASIADSPS